MEKFEADIKRLIKRDREEHGKVDAHRVRTKIAGRFQAFAPDKALTGLAQSLADYWLARTERAGETPVEDVDWLLDALSFLEGGETGTSISRSDWEEIRAMVSQEAEDLPLDALSAMMQTLVAKGVV